MAKTFEGWDEEVWHEWQAKLGRLSLKQLDVLVQAVGINFGESKPETIEGYILVLDEADPALLEQKYKEIIDAS